MQAGAQDIFLDRVSKFWGRSQDNPWALARAQGIKTSGPGLPAASSSCAMRSRRPLSSGTRQYASCQDVDCL
eukprot:2113634-Amphidinium_carterae.1